MKGAKILFTQDPMLEGDYPDSVMVTYTALDELKTKGLVTFDSQYNFYVATKHSSEIYTALRQR